MNLIFIHCIYTIHRKIYLNVVEWWNITHQKQWLRLRRRLVEVTDKLVIVKSDGVRFPLERMNYLIFSQAKKISSKLYKEYLYEILTTNNDVLLMKFVRIMS